MSKRHKTKKDGVFYREAKRIGGKGTEKVYYVVFKKAGKTQEVKVGRQYADQMTPARAALLRSDYIEGRRLTPKEQRKLDEGRWTIDRLWEFFEENKKSLKSIDTDRIRYHKHIKPYLKNKLVDELVTLDIDRIRKRLGKTHAPASVKQVLVLIKRMIRLGAMKGNFFMPDISRLNFEMPKVNNQVTEDLSPAQLERLMTVLRTEPNQMIANMMRLALFSGVRRSELFRLQWDHLNFDKSMIRLVDPKGGKDQIIPMNDAARYLLKNHIGTDSPYVFPGKWDGQMVDCKKSLRRIADKAGLPKNFRPLHGLRHTYASALASSGKVDMQTLQKLMTHQSMAMTERYAHLRDEALKKAAGVASDIFSKNKTA
jgi:integrase